MTQPVVATSLQVTDLDDIPMDMVAKTLPNNTYAVFTHRVALSEMPVKP